MFELAVEAGGVAQDDARFGEPFAVTDRGVLTGIGVVDEPVEGVVASVPQGVLERGEWELGAEVGGERPAEGVWETGRRRRRRRRSRPRRAGRR